MSAPVIAGLVAGYGIAIPVGAVGTFLVALTARSGLRVGIPAALGVATADGIYALVAVLGGRALARLIAPITGPLRVIAALVLLAIAIRIVVQAVARYRSGTPSSNGIDPDPRPWRAYFALLGITLLNPATVIYFAALVAGNAAGGLDSVGAGAAFVLAATVASASWQLLVVGGGALLGRALTGRRGALMTGVVSGTVIGGLAAQLLLAS